MTLAAKHRLWTVISYVLGWTVFALFYFSQAVAQKVMFGDPTPWWHFLVIWIIGIYTFAFLTLGVLWLGRRFPIQRHQWLRQSVLHLLFSICFALADLLIVASILPHLHVMPSVFKSFQSSIAFLLIIDFHGAVLGYWTILGVQAGLRYYRAYQERQRQALKLELQASELRNQLAHAQLSALKMQLQPHFLFNTLNAITVLVRQQKGPAAEEMLAHLSDLLRCVLEDVEAQEVPLRRELEYLRIYLSIQQVRFQDRLRVHIAAAPETLEAALPQMALQPIVENAIRHGFGALARAGEVQISAYQEAGNLVIQVEDDGPGFCSGAPSGSGIGLANTKARLRQLYSDRAELLTGNRPNGGAIVTLVIPFHLAAPTHPSDILEVHAVQSLTG